MAGQKKVVDVNEAYQDLKTLGEIVNKVLEEAKTPTTSTTTTKTKRGKKLRNSLIAAGLVLGTAIGGTAIIKPEIFKQETVKKTSPTNHKPITSKDTLVGKLQDHFQKNKYEEVPWYYFYGEECKKCFVSYMDFLKSFEVSPEIISEFNKKSKTETSQALGLYLSAMIQTSYNQGHNNFKFEEINAKRFGAFLKGQQENPIRIEVTKILKGNESLHHAKNSTLKTKKLEGNYSLESAEDCSLTAETLEGDYSLFDAKNCPLTVETLKGYLTLEFAKNCKARIKTLEGNNSFWSVEDSLAEITNYKGTNFGYVMKNCTIKSENKETLELIKKQTKGRNNKFELKR